MLTIHDLVKWAIEDFKEQGKYGLIETEDKAYDLISEIADSRVPIYNYQILEVAMSNFRLALTEPECWPALWEKTPIHYIMANIYEEIREKLLERYCANKNENVE